MAATPDTFLARFTPEHLALCQSFVAMTATDTYTPTAVKNFVVEEVAPLLEVVALVANLDLDNIRDAIAKTTLYHSKKELARLEALLRSEAK